MGLLVALLMSAVLMAGGCAQDEESVAPEETREEATDETTAEPTVVERTVIKETTVVVQPPAPSPAEAPSSEIQEVPPKVEIPPKIEIPPQVEIPPEAESLPEVEIPHDGTVIPCFQDPVCSSEQARIQSEHVAELEADRANKQPGSPNLHNMCRQAVQAKTQLPQACRSLGG